jgi:hypothetical protein
MGKKRGWVVMKKGKKKASDFYCTYSCKAIREIKTMKNSMQVGNIFFRSLIRETKRSDTTL